MLNKEMRLQVPTLRPLCCRDRFLGMDSLRSGSVVKIQMASKGFREIKVTTGKELYTMPREVYSPSLQSSFSFGLLFMETRNIMYQKMLAAAYTYQYHSVWTSGGLCHLSAMGFR